jgi:hypothetical protein
MNRNQMPALAHVLFTGQSDAGPQSDIDLLAAIIRLIFVGRF